MVTDAAHLKARQETWKPFEEVRAHWIEGFQPLIEGYYNLKARLEQEGFLLDADQGEFPTFVPVQLMGLLPSGEAFYLRCRHATCSRRIAPAGGDPITKPKWEQAVSRWEGEAASMLEAEEAEAVLQQLLTTYSAETSG